MSRRDTLWGALCEAFGCNKLAKARDDVNDALKSFAGFAGDRVAANVKLAHCEAELLRTDPNEDWHRFANLKDREVELHKELAKVYQQCDSARRKLDTANARLAKIEGNDDAPAITPASPRYADLAATAAGDDYRDRIAEAFRVPARFLRGVPIDTSGGGDLGTAAGG